MDSTIADHLERTARGDAGLPGLFFSSADAYTFEVKYFFRRQWLCIGLSTDVSRPSDWHSVDVLGQSLLLVRNSSGKLSVFYNVCSHRGAQLLTGSHRGPTLVCPYHCWTYNSNGNLVRTPHAAGANRHDSAEIDRSRHGLRELRSAEYGGLVFACFDEPSESFVEQIQPLLQRWPNVDFTRLDCVRDLRQQPVFRANWKVVVENFVESYHLPWVHPELNRINPMGLHYQILGGDRYLGQGSGAYAPTDIYEASLPLMPNLEGKDRARGESIYLPPNLMLICFPDFLLVNIVLPRGPAETEERLELFVARHAAQDERYHNARAGLMQFMTAVNTEDIRICETVQRGRASDAFKGGVFVPQQEATSLQFQQILARRLLGERAAKLAPLRTADVYHPVADKRTTM